LACLKSRKIKVRNAILMSWIINLDQTNASQTLNAKAREYVPHSAGAEEKLCVEFTP